METDLRKIQKLLDAAEGNLTTARNLMRQVLETKVASPIDIGGKAKDLSVIDEGKIVEGVFNGEEMVGADGKEYPIPANYASKSKLVEGDTLKLTIADDGSFVYKQISPIERRKTVGTLAFTGGNYLVEADGKDYQVLPASITYFKGQPGDQVTIILPKDNDSTWAAVENVIKKGTLGDDAGDGPKDSPKTESPKTEEKPVEEKTEKKEDAQGPEIEYPKSEPVEEKPKETEQADTVPKIKKEETDMVFDEGIKELEI